MSMMASKILFAQLFVQAQIKENIKASMSLAFVRVIHQWLVDFPSQKASNVENVSIWWHDNAVNRVICPIHVCLIAASIDRNET